jgi:hypothetical protein
MSPNPLVAGTFNLQFPQFVGKEYQLESSTDLELWTPSGDPFIGTATALTLATPLPPAGTQRMFYRASVKDTDFDFDSLSSYEESIICSNPNLADSDGDGVDDDVEYQYGSNPCDNSDGGTPQPITPAQLPPPKPIKFRLFTGVLLGSSYSQISPSATFLTPYNVNVFKKHKTTGVETLVYTMSFPPNANSVFNDITLPVLPDFVYTVQADIPDLSSSSLVQAFRDFSFIVNLAPQTGGLPFAVAPRFNPAASPPLGALGSVGFNHGAPYNPHAIGYSNYRLVVSPLVIEKVISDQIAGNDANQLPTRAYGGQPNNPMVMATRSGVDARLRVEADLWPPIAPIALVAVREIATGTIKGSTLALPKPAQTPVQFNASNGSKMHEVVSGLDLNNNGILDPAEVKNVFEKTPRLNVDGKPYGSLPLGGKDTTFSQLDKFFVITQADFNTARLATQDYGELPYSLAVPYTSGLLYAFATGANTIAGTTSEIPVSISANGIGLPSSNGLSFALGGRWDTVNQVTSHRIVYTPTSGLSTLLAESKGAREMYKSVIGKNKVAILAAATPNYTSYTISNVVDDSINFKDDDADIKYSIGKCKFSGELILSMRTVPGGFEVGQMRCNGSFSDLYDFGWPGAKITIPYVSILNVDIGDAIKTQAGHATLATAPNSEAGRVFLVRVDAMSQPIPLNVKF